MSDWIVRGEKSNGDVVKRDATSRSDAEETKAEAEDLGLSNVEIIPPGDAEADGGAVPENPGVAKDEGESPEEAAERISDDGVTAEVVDHSPDAEAQDGDYDLPDDGPSVDEDPLVWMPEEFTDTIDGTVAINRKGFEVLAHHYDISCTTDVSEALTNAERIVFKATATDADGDVYTAFGSAGAERGDTDRPTVEMADTRAYKRAISRATGVGMVAVEELQDSL
jgi:hypothetical protein